MSRFGARFALLVFTLVAAIPLFAATFTSSQNGNWSSASTWGGAGVPGAGDTATVNHTVTLDIPVSLTIRVADLKVQLQNARIQLNVIK